MLITVKDRELYEGHENFSHVALKPTIPKYRGRDRVYGKGYGL